MTALKSVLVGVDFSACSEDAFRQAARIAELRGATLTAVHAVSPFLLAPLLDVTIPSGFPPAIDVIGEAKERWAHFASDAPAHQRARFDVEVGGGRATLLEHVRRKRPDLLVIGAHSDLDAKRSIGTTASGCVERAGTTVLVVREGQRGMFKSVVACVDFSETSRLALEEAIRWAVQDNASLHVLHVYASPWPDDQMPASVRTNMPDFGRQYRAAIEAKLRRFCAPMNHELNALKAEYHVLQVRSHGEGIIAFVQRHGCDLVVLGTRGTWNVRDFLWGATAERVVREAPCSILAIKPPGFQQPAQSQAAEVGADAAGEPILSASRR